MAKFSPLVKKGKHSKNIQITTKITSCILISRKQTSCTGWLQLFWKRGHLATAAVPNTLTHRVVNMYNMYHVDNNVQPFKGVLDLPEGWKSPGLPCFNWLIRFLSSWTSSSFLSSKHESGISGNNIRTLITDLLNELATCKNKKSFFKDTEWER